MKKVTKYEAADGTLFDSQAEALKHETHCQLVEHLKSDERIYWRDPSIDAVAESVLEWLERRDMPDAVKE